MMLIAGSLLTHLLSVWHYVRIDGVMVNSFEMLLKKKIYNTVIKIGIKKFLGVDDEVSVWIDSGGYQFLTHNINPSIDKLAKLYFKLKMLNSFEAFYVSLDYPPSPMDSEETRRLKIEKTIRNYNYLLSSIFSKDSSKLIPVIHLTTNMGLLQKQVENYSDAAIVGVGGLVPYVLSRGPKDSRLVSFAFILLVKRLLKDFVDDVKVHVFGLGAPSVIPFLKLLGIYSTDSMTWRIKAAYGKIILPCTGERHITDREINFGRKKLSVEEFEFLLRLIDEFNSVSNEKIRFEDLKESFVKRAIFNFWVLNMYAHNYGNVLLPKNLRKLYYKVKELTEMDNDDIFKLIISRFKQSMIKH